MHSLLLALVVCASPASGFGAEFLYETLAGAFPNAAAIIGDYYPSYYHNFDDVEAAVQFRMAASSTPGQRFRVETYGVQLDNRNNFPAPLVEFELSLDDQGMPGAVIDRFEATGATSDFFGSRHFAESATSPLVSAGELYWLMARVPSSLGGVLWHHGHAEPFSQKVIYRIAYGEWQVDYPYSSPAFRIVGLSVPEPVALYQLVALCGIALGARKRRPGHLLADPGGL
jgi:hypothetical protein